MSRVMIVGTIGRDTQKNAPAHFRTEANVTDQHASQRADDSVSLDGAADSLAFPDAEAFVRLQARFAMHGWELEPDPRLDGSIAYIAANLGRFRGLKSLGEVCWLLAAVSDPHLQDELRELRIRLAGDRMLASMRDAERDPENHALHRDRAKFSLRQQNSLIRGRSAAQVARMERDRGLL